MEFTEDWLRDFVASRAIKTWNDNNRPYYISSIGEDIKEEKADYVKIIAPRKLRQWVLSTNFPGVKVIADRQHPARVAFVPEGVDYEFGDSQAKAETDGPERSDASQSEASAQSRRRLATLRFLDVLSTLPDKELEGINIPLKTIVRLLAK